MDRAREYTLASLKKMVREIFVPVFSKPSIMLLDGSLGAGKTTLVREILTALGVKEVVTSPTFTYVNRYQDTQRRTYYHFDLYRLKNLNEFIAAGFDEYIYEKNSSAIIEWPSIVRPLYEEGLLDKDWYEVIISYCGRRHNARMLKMHRVLNDASYPVNKP